MSDSDPLDIRYVAGLARIELTEEEAGKFELQLEHILEYMHKLDQIDVNGIEPTAHANPVLNITRPDETKPGLTSEEALANGPQTGSNQFIVPKVVE